MPIVPKLPRLALSTLIITAVTVVFSPAKSADVHQDLKGGAWQTYETNSRDDEERVKILEEISQTRDDLAELERKRFRMTNTPQKLAEITTSIQIKDTHIQRLELALKHFD